MMCKPAYFFLPKFKVFYIKLTRISSHHIYMYIELMQKIILDGAACNQHILVKDKSRWLKSGVFGVFSTAQYK